MVIAPAGWWLAESLSRPLRLPELAGAPLIGLDTRDALGGLLRGHLEELDPPPRIDTWVQTYQLARALVAAGQGLALVDPLTAAAGEGAVERRPLEPLIQVRLYALTRAQEAPSSAQLALLEQVRVQAERLMGPVGG